MSLPLTRWAQQARPVSPHTDWGAEEPNSAVVGPYITYLPDNSFDPPTLLLFDTRNGAWSVAPAAPLDSHGDGASVGVRDMLYVIGGYTYDSDAERWQIP